MILTPPDETSSPTRSHLPWSPLKRLGQFTLKEWAFVAAILGSLGFIVGRVWLAEFYHRLRLTPEEVGLDRAELLTTVLTAAVVVGVVSILSFVLVLVFFWFFAWFHSYYDRRLIRSLSILDRMEPGWMRNVMRMFFYPLISVNRAQLNMAKYLSALYAIVPAGAMIFLISILPQQAADGVLAGSERNWMERALLPVQATCVEVRWLETPQRHDSAIPPEGGSYIYMGEADTFAILVRPENDSVDPQVSAATIRVPASMITFVSSINTNCRS